jgi:hypothetical protein
MRRRMGGGKGIGLYGEQNSTLFDLTFAVFV